MVLITLTEIFYLIIMSLVVGYIFTGLVRTPETYGRKRFDWEEFKLALYVSAPAIVLHELAHKFVALGFGLAAKFEVFWAGLGIALVLKLVNSPILLIAPGYVLIQGMGSNFAHFLISLSGPLTNLVLFGIAKFMLDKKKLNRNQTIFWGLTKQINIFLFIFNMLPITPLDGFSVFRNLIAMVF